MSGSCSRATLVDSGSPYLRRSGSSGGTVVNYSPGKTAGSFVGYSEGAGEFAGVFELDSSYGDAKSFSSPRLTRPVSTLLVTPASSRAATASRSSSARKESPVRQRSTFGSTRAMSPASVRAVSPRAMSPGSVRVSSGSTRSMSPGSARAMSPGSVRAVSPRSMRAVTDYYKEVTPFAGSNRGSRISGDNDFLYSNLSDEEGGQAYSRIPSASAPILEDNDYTFDRGVPRSPSRSRGASRAGSRSEGFPQYAQSFE